MLPSQAGLFKIRVPSYFKKWINIKRFILQKWGINCKGMMEMLEEFEINHVVTKIPIIQLSSFVFRKEAHKKHAQYDVASYKGYSHDKI